MVARLLPHVPPTCEDDGLFIEPVGAWAEEKYRRFAMYAELFTGSMRAKWQRLVYIDLFAGAGYARIEGSGRIVPAAAMLAARLKVPFDHYVFCDSDAAKLDDLKRRVDRDHPGTDARFIPGDVNAHLGVLLGSLPTPSATNKVLSFCFVDPYRCSSFRFETIRGLSKIFVDFFVLIPSYMDANRNLGRYEQSGNKTIADFLGDADWREEWKADRHRYKNFGDFVADKFGRQMKALGYIYDGLAANTHLVRNTQKNSPIYRLAMFGRHPLVKTFWKQVEKYASDQTAFDFGEG